MDLQTLIQRTLSTIFTLLLLCGMATASLAQHAPLPDRFELPPYNPAGRTGQFLPLPPIPEPRCGRFTAAQVRQIGETLRQIDALFRKLPVLNPPVGVTIKPHWHFDRDDCEGPGGNPLRPSLAWWSYREFDNGGRDTHSPGGVEIYLNPRHALFHKRVFKDESGAVYEAPVATATVAGYRVFGRTVDILQAAEPSFSFRVFVTQRKEPYWVPVSRERYLRNQIAEAHAEKAKFEKELAGTLKPDAAQSPYQKWLREAPQRKQQHEQAMAAIIAVMPDSAAVIRARFAEIERQTEQMLRETDATWKQSHAQGVDLYQNRILVDAERRITKLQAILAAMSESERRSQAWLERGRIVHPDDMLVPANTPKAVALVAPNPQFYDSTRPHTEVQAMLVRFEVYHGTMQWRYEAGLFAEVFRTLDWAQLTSFVR